MKALMGLRQQDAWCPLASSLAEHKQQTKQNNPQANHKVWAQQETLPQKE